MEDKKKIRYTIIGVLVLLITITSSTYAYFAITASNSTTVTSTVASVGLVLNVEKITPENSGVDVLIPQLESALGSAISSTYNCIDDNNNTVCQVYKASLTNNGNATVRVKGTIAFVNINNIPHLKWKLIDSATSIGSNTGTTASTTATNFITETTLTNNQTKDYYFVVWIDETGSIQNESGTFTATLTFTDSNGRGLTSTIGAEPASSTKYTVNIYDIDAEGSNSVWLNQAIPNAITGYDTPAAAMAAFNNNPFYLKHTLGKGTRWCIKRSDGYDSCDNGFIIDSENECLALLEEAPDDGNTYQCYSREMDIVTESYVEFVVTSSMASVNPGMTAGTYALRGYTDGTYYSSNVNVLKQAFGENSGYCSGDSSYLNCDVSGLNAGAYSSGDVNAGAGSSSCSVFYDGGSRCNVGSGGGGSGGEVS